ncbi:IS4 family transposase [Aquibium carbonis]|uniref:IS4 family transposase n=1 Tax=Aquibium carbonis TaxID=2495581 RepID=A0A3R9YTV9_9HYPH|nr:IS4 family transposase [Aquibium carbonis]RST86998.1 IS4 family transposase [Aquibium carbonis]
MRHDNSVFHSLQKHIPWCVFDALVEKHRTDRRVRRLDTKSQLLALLFGQLSGAASLREIEAGLASHASRLYHLGASPAARSTLADANAKRSWQVFAELFAHMARTACRNTRRHLADAACLLDATRIELGGASAGWLSAQNGRRAVKLHIAYDLAVQAPLSAEITDQKVADVTPAKTLPITPGMTYVFDLAYYDYGWWARLDAQGCRFVTRLKVHTTIEAAQRLALPEGSDVLSDRIGFLPQRMAASRRNPFAAPVRELTVRISIGKIIRLVTNDLDAPAQDIADFYEARWQIELFFKWIKQNLKIARFLGTSENAIRIQLFVALIAYLVLRAAHAAQKAVARPLTFARLVRLNLMHRRPIDELTTPPNPPRPNPNQISFAFLQS